MPTLLEVAQSPFTIGRVVQVVKIDTPENAPPDTWLWNNEPFSSYLRNGSNWSSWEGSVLMMCCLGPEELTLDTPIAVKIADVRGKGKSYPITGYLWYLRGAEYVHVEYLPDYAIIPVANSSDADDGDH